MKQWPQTILPRRWPAVLVGAVVVGGAVFALAAAEGPLWQQATEAQPMWRAESAAPAEAATLALAGGLGGLRTVAADVLWLQVYECWLDRDATRLPELLAQVQRVDPRHLPFALSGARMLAADVPRWSLAPGAPPPTEAEWRHRRAAAGAQALALLDQARRHHPQAPELLFEQGLVAWANLGDAARAAAYFREAWALPHTTLQAAQLATEMEVRADHPERAAAFLREAVLPRLAPGSQTAAVVRQRLAELEAAADTSP